MRREQQIAKALYDIHALQLSPKKPFQWSSGILSPVYCDNRLVMSYVDVRKTVTRELSNKIKEDFPEVEVIAGCATAGIPHAAFVAEQLNLPMVYVRDKAKSHGKQNRIEGHIEEGQKAVVIEDLISTGKSSIQAAKSLQDEGVNVLGVSAIFTYGLKKAEEAFKQESLPYTALTNFAELLTYMSDHGHLDLKEKERLMQWSEDPNAFSLTYQS
ncbi:orotate phosphoribosyltransferase [Pontibacillus marinus BH030004 = DSM 16465]|uniref:Orotate phosphoribosyltransferase n=2 Tax=Pontibacillus TaxID=289201 RepID=A0A0A5G3J6_9BACI|nr:orotate phosphoribosyltransferase [Pontibacillus marinus]KGX85713.1 orotate phosphoribosyltransferase [Pontibacillus marinus BH030004 = DSM 16465]